MHLIHQHTFDIQCSSQDFGKEIHSQLSMLLEKEFYPKLETLLNKYDSKTNTLSVDFLNIEIPAISKKYWKEELVQKSLTQIEDFLIRNQQMDLGEKDKVNSSLISNSNHAKILFFEFLKTGKIIENTIAKDVEKLVAEVEVSADFIVELLIYFGKNSNYLMRWIFSVPDFFKEIVTNKLDGFSTEFIKFFDTFLKNSRNQNSETNKIITKIDNNSILKKQWLELMQWLKYLEIEGIFNAKEFVQLSEDFFDINSKELGLVCQIILDNKHGTSETKDFFEKIKRNLNHDVDVNEVKKIEEDFQFNIDHNEKEVGNLSYINNAGLVIVHPFLKALFDQLNLCDSKGNWKSKVSQHKAILLTQFLVDSNNIIQESDLMLNKILCGFAIDEVVNVKLKITEKEIEKCNSLLDAVKEHWKVMSTSSREALQQTFLQREAKLESVKRNEFELWVEEKGVDILLEQLPWGIGMIKTPWMENYLNCHW